MSNPTPDEINAALLRSFPHIVDISKREEKRKKGEQVSTAAFAAITTAQTEVSRRAKLTASNKARSRKPKNTNGLEDVPQPTLAEVKNSKLPDVTEDVELQSETEPESTESE